MSYKPKFCCQCGEAIERKSWTFLASRRFCQLCETDYKFDGIINKAVVTVGILLGIVGLSTFLQKTEKPLTVASNNYLSNQANIGKSAAVLQNPTNSNDQSLGGIRETNPVALQPQTKSPLVPTNQSLKAEKNERQQNTAQETVYFCGAETKKGTPCTRRVKGGGRCWQHIGKPAMLPAEKLIASQ